MPTLPASLNEQEPVTSGARDVCSARTRKSPTLRISVPASGIASIAEAPNRSRITPAGGVRCC